jgi:hypothetical protein
VEWGSMHWISLTQDRDRWWVLVYVVKKLWVPYNTEYFLNNRGPVRFSEKT